MAQISDTEFQIGSVYDNKFVIATADCLWSRQPIARANTVVSYF